MIKPKKHFWIDRGITFTGGTIQEGRGFQKGNQVRKGKIPWNPKGSKRADITGNDHHMKRQECRDQVSRSHIKRTGGGRNWWSKKLRKEYKLCVLCKGSNDVMHHKDENPENNTRSNLIVICWTCHEFWHQRAAKDD